MSLVKTSCSGMARGRDSKSDDEDDSARGRAGSGEEEEEDEEGVGGRVLDEILGGFSEDELHEVEDGGTESTRSTAIIARNAQAAQTGGAAKGAAPSGSAPERTAAGAGQQNNVGDGRRGAEDPRGRGVFPPDRGGPGHGQPSVDERGAPGGMGWERGAGPGGADRRPPGGGGAGGDGGFVDHGPPFMGRGDGQFPDRKLPDNVGGGFGPERGEGWGPGGWRGGGAGFPPLQQGEPRRDGPPGGGGGGGGYDGGFPGAAGPGGRWQNGGGNSPFSGDPGRQDAQFGGERGQWTSAGPDRRPMFVAAGAPRGSPAGGGGDPRGTPPGGGGRLGPSPSRDFCMPPVGVDRCASPPPIDLPTGRNSAIFLEFAKYE